MPKYSNEIFNDVEGFFDTLVEICELFSEVVVGVNSLQYLIQLIPYFLILLAGVKVYKSL